MQDDVPNLSQLPKAVKVTNDQRHDAALTVAQYSDDMPENAAYYLTMIGLAEEREDGFHSIGTDEFEMPWFTPAVPEEVGASGPTF